MLTIDIIYRCWLTGGEETTFEIHLDPDSLRRMGPMPAELPNWTELGFKQCPNCQLAVVTHPHCPLAVELVDIVPRFDHLLSYNRIEAEVVTVERTVRVEASVQRVLSSLMGLLFAVSACPWTTFFKPLARYHLPLATTEETMWRVISTFLLGRHFQSQAGRTEPADLDALATMYAHVQVVNGAFAERLRVACQQDSVINALILLDMFAKSVPFAIDDALDEIRPLIVPFFQPDMWKMSISAG
ncbi:MAG: hypothetical protein QNJ22_11035 [Desulfosarcinaceae bacterium]|nr:hypothetical protein [Desulfosarcinaceae bacterium]